MQLSKYVIYLFTAGFDYLAVHEPIVFRVNRENRVCVDITIFNDTVSGEFHEVFLVQLTAIDTPLTGDRAIVVIRDQGNSRIKVCTSYKWVNACSNKCYESVLYYSCKPRFSHITLVNGERLNQVSRSNNYINVSQYSSLIAAYSP